MPSLKIRNNQHWDIQGALTFKTIAEVEQISKSLRENWSQQVTIDFNGMTSVDSAGIAWILENIKYSQQKKIALVLQNFDNEEGKTLAKIHGIDAMLSTITKEVK